MTTKLDELVDLLTRQCGGGLPGSALFGCYTQESGHGFCKYFSAFRDECRDACRAMLIALVQEEVKRGE